MAKKQSLGRGLDLIFDDNTVTSDGNVSYIDVNSIKPKKNQPRKKFDENPLAELAQSISLHGVLQPILVRDLKNGSYEIIAGERRWRASRLAGLSEVPCIVRNADEAEASELALIENIQREDLNPLEEAKAYRSLMDDWGLSQEEVSKKVGKSRPAIANAVRLLDLPEKILDLLLKNSLTAGHCKALLALTDENDMIFLAEKAVKKNWSVRETETAVKTLNRQNAKAESGSEKNGLEIDYYAELEKKAKDICGRQIRIAYTGKRKSIQIEYTSVSDLEEILEKVCGKSLIENPEDRY